jgi:hypothetical protein
MPSRGKLEGIFCSCQALKHHRTHRLKESSEKNLQASTPALRLLANVTALEVNRKSLGWQIHQLEISQYVTIYQAKQTSLCE